jgi:hypothetical protein
MPCHRLQPVLATLVAAAALAVPPARAGDAPLAVAEPGKTSDSTPRKPERARWSWNRIAAQVTPSGDLQWQPEPFALQLGKTVHYIDYEKGSDDADGSKAKPWKHHPWDPAATGTAKAASGPATYVFKRGVVYRGELVPAAEAGGTDAEPVRLTSDPGWGTGEAVIAGTERVTAWTKGADRADIPDAAKVWSAEVPFAPRSVWVVDGDKSTRVELARTPNWTVSDPENVKSEWFRFQQPNWWENGCTKWKKDFNGHRAWEGVDAANLTGKAEDYVGATAHVEYGWVMGTPFPTTVEGFDPGSKGIFFQGIWFGDSENVVAGMHYYLEDKPNFLDSPGEFWFDEGKHRLYLRLPGDADPNTGDVEVAKRINLLESSGIAHLVVSGLTFRGTNTHWDLAAPPWMHPDVNNAAVRIRGRAEDVRIDHCRFLDVGKAVRIDANGNSQEKRKDEPLDRVVIADNDIDRTDHGAIEILSHSVGDIKVLRNHLHLIGLRTFRQDHSHALCVSCPETMEIAGNILERCTGSGIFVFGGKGSGEGRDVPLSRTLIHHNRATDTLLSANDWGGIETWQGGPFYNYDNISANPNGFWNGYDPNKPGTARLGFAYYHDGAYKNYDFNEVAIGSSDEWKSPHCCMAAFYEAGATIENQIFNCTITRFWVATQWSPGGGRHFFLGNVFDDIGGMVFQHGQLKEDKGKPGAYPHESMAYGHNVFSRVPNGVTKAADGNTQSAFSVYEVNGAAHESLESMVASFAAHPALAFDVGTLAKESPLRDPEKGDLRPKAGSAAIDHGVKVFVPWGLSRTVGEWQFRRNNADHATIFDSHWYMTPYYTNRDQYSQTPAYSLKAQNVGEKDFIAGPLEDWTDSALSFNGKDQFASISQADMGKPYQYDAGNNQKKTAQGKELATPDIDTSSLLIEAYVLAKQPGTVLVSKLSGNGYQLAINHAGGATFTVVAGGQKAELASGAKLVDGKWHHVVAELDRAAGTMAIYTDGKKTADGKATLANDASLANDGDLLVGKNADGHFFAGAIEFLRIARSTLAESKTSIEELYDWEFDGPFLRDFAGREPTGKGRDAGAYELEK